MLGQLIDGEWRTTRKQNDNDGHFVRTETTFRDHVRDDSSARFQPESGRYHLYVSWACPWAHRTLLTRALTGLEEAVSISVVAAHMGEDGWAFSDEPGAIPDTLNGAKYLREIYQKAAPNMTGRVTVPVLWDKKHETIVNNESREIMRMFNTVFRPLASTSRRLAPAHLIDQIDQAIDDIYDPINNGVYKCGFATKQAAYDKSVEVLFSALDRYEALLSRQRYVVGETLTEADLCLFATLLRFDLVYATHFKCNLKRIVDYPNLWDFTREVYQLPGVAEVCNIDHIKRHYYTSHESVNPHGIVAAGFDVDFDEPHSRG
ncbi:MAG: glutathione S-transferase family protein [Myxococcales bacterium]|nr:glutathione S-transferase family protein [Myxococcales bacterium]